MTAPKQEKGYSIEPWIPVTVAAAVALLCFLVAYAVFAFAPGDNDDTVFLFQARLFASGKLYGENPPMGVTAFPTLYFNTVYQGTRWQGQYPFGNGLALAIGVLAGCPFAVPALLSGGAVLVLFFFCRDVFGERAAFFTLLLAAISPLTIGLGATLFSENVSRFCLLLFTWSFFRLLDDRKKESSSLFWWSLLNGSALGYAVNTRPLSAVIFGGISGAYLLWEFVRSGQRRKIVRCFLPAGGCFSLFLAAAGGWNYLLTGNPLVFAHEGYELYGFNDDFRPQHAWRRFLRLQLPKTLYSATGWGYLDLETLVKLFPVSGAPRGGIYVKDLSTGAIRIVKALGFDDGNAHVEINVKRGQHEHPLVQPGRMIVNTTLGVSSVGLKVEKHGRVIAFSLRDSPQHPWKEISSGVIEGAGPLEVGLFGGAIHNLRSSKIAFSKIRYAEFSPQPSPCVQPIDAPGSWRVRMPSPEYGRVEVIDRARVEISPRKESDLFGEDTSLSLACSPGSADFELEVENELFWRDWFAPVRRIAGLTSREIVYLLGSAVICFPLFCALGGALFGGRRSIALFLLLLWVGEFIGYGSFCFESWGHSLLPHSARYYSEATLIGFLPLVGHALASMTTFMLRVLGKVAGGVFVALVSIALMVNSGCTILRFVPMYRDNFLGFQRDMVNVVLPKLVEDLELHYVVVFIPQGTIRPLGDYPFESLQQADRVYVWLLPGQNWKDEYERHYRGRSAYLYRDRSLVPLIVMNRGKEGAETIPYNGSPQP